MKWLIVFITIYLFATASFANEDTSEPNVKKSKNDICHDKSSRSYNRTKNYTPYETIKECLASGGRLPIK
jgi:CDP-diacylglycerol pyrophosphatase